MAQTPAVRVQEGKVVPYTFTADAVQGDIIEVGTIPMVVAHAVDFSENALGELEVDGVFDVPQVAGVITAGDAVYWDSNGSPYGGTALSGCATGTATANNLMGVACPIQRNGTNATTATDTYVRVYLTAAKRTATIAGIVTADSITGSSSTLPIAGLQTGSAGLLSVTGGTSTTAASAGGAVSVIGGTPGTTGVGGGITITTGAGGATSGNSGALTIGTGTCTAAASGVSGAVILRSANGATGTAAAGGASGTLTINTGAGGVGTAFDGGAAGTLAITGGAGGSTSAADAGGAGAAVTVLCGVGGLAVGAGTGGAGGAFSATAGAGGATAAGTSGAGGAASLIGGAGGAGGIAGAGGAGGAIVITSGIGGATTTGAGTTGAGGAITLTAANGGATGATATCGAGGTISLVGGTGGSAVGAGVAGAGGNIVLTPGGAGTHAGGTAGKPGMIRLEGVPAYKNTTVTAKTTAATLTCAELLTGILTGTHTVGATAAYTLPTGTLMTAGTPCGDTDGFYWHLINLSAAEADSITVTAGADHTIVGSPIVISVHANTGGSITSMGGNSSTWFTKKIHWKYWVTYRVG